MISIIRIITDSHRPFSFTQTSAKHRAGRIAVAKKRIIIYTEKISDEEVDSIVGAKQLNPLEKTCVFVDCSPDSMMRGTISYRGVTSLIKAGVTVTTPLIKPTVSFTVVDNNALFYSPYSEAREGMTSYGLEFDLGETETLLQSIFEWSNDPVIVEENQHILQENIKDFENKVNKIDLKKYGSVLYDKLKDKIRFVEIPVKGLKILTKVIPIKSKYFRFKDKGAEDKFKARFKLFSRVDQDKQAAKCKDGLQEVQTKIDAVKTEYLKSLGKYGLCIETEKMKEFKKALEVIQIEEVEKLQNSISNELRSMLDASRYTLKAIIGEFYDKKLLNMKEDSRPGWINNPDGNERDRFLKNAMDDVDFPTVDELLNCISVDLIFKGLTVEICSEDCFIAYLEKALNFKKEYLFK